MSTRANPGQDQAIESQDQEPDSAEMTMDNLEINELLSSISTDADRIPDDDPYDSTLADTGTFAAVEILMSPEEIFPDEDGDD